MYTPSSIKRRLNQTCGKITPKKRKDICKDTVDISNRLFNESETSSAKYKYNKGQEKNTKRKYKKIYEENVRTVKKRCKKGTRVYKFMIRACEEYKNNGKLIMKN